jgi:hypothetical protein
VFSDADQNKINFLEGLQAPFHCPDTAAFTYKMQHKSKKIEVK